MTPSPARAAAGSDAAVTVPGPGAVTATQAQPAAPFSPPASRTRAKDKVSRPPASVPLVGVSISGQCAVRGQAPVLSLPQPTLRYASLLLRLSHCFLPFIFLCDRQLTGTPLVPIAVPLVWRLEALEATAAPVGIQNCGNSCYANSTFQVCACH